MVTMSAIWDRTAEVLRGRGGMLAVIAAAMLFLPAVMQNAFAVYGGHTPGARLVTALVGLVAALVTLWGNLALVAASSDPAADRDAAVRHGARRLLPMLGLSMLVALAFVLLILPILGILRVAGVNYGTVAMGSPPVLPHGAVVAVLAYGMVLAALALWLSARLSLLAPVVVNERRGMGSFARSFELTRGLAWRIVGVLVLFGVLILVANTAARAVVGLVARLLGAGVPTATFLAVLAGAAVIAGATTVSATFLAQLYRVTSGRELDGRGSGGGEFGGREVGRSHG